MEIKHNGKAGVLCRSIGHLEQVGAVGFPKLQQPFHCEPQQSAQSVVQLLEDCSFVCLCVCVVVGGGYDWWHRNGSGQAVMPKVGSVENAKH